MIISRKISENLIYLFIWLMVCSLPVFTLRGDEDFNWTRIGVELFRILPFMLIFIVNNSLLVPHFLFKKQNTQYILYTSLSIIVIALIFVLMNFVHDYLSHPYPPMFDNAMPPGPPSELGARGPHMPSVHDLTMGERLFDVIIISFLVVGFNSAVKLAFKQQEEEQNIEEQKKIHIQTELSFLKQQISPHFFMNTLNNIHALVDISSEETKDAIIKLSNMMGYMLYESRTDKISVKKEIEFVKSYVELMRLRFTDDIEIVLDIPDTLPAVSIPPLLTISFIENAFKHGVSYEAPSFVHMSFSFTESRMLFEIKNTIHSKKRNNENSGIGLQNSRNRFALIFENNYELTMDQSPENVFLVKLNIPI